MAAIRRNILRSTQARDKFIQGVTLLKQDFAGPTSADFGLPGPTTPLNTYDLFVVWHHVTMNTLTPPNQADRNAAHRGPIFLPWHRYLLIVFEVQLQRVLNDPAFGAPYWDWAADGQRSAARQATSRLWGAKAMGGQGDPVATGPLAFNAADPNTWRVRIASDANNQLRQVNRGLRRKFGSFAPSLPRKADAREALALATYDGPPWNSSSSGFRNDLEGWIGPGLHNRVHLWVGGDMLLASSPNDPVFFLNHCNVDRIWAAWLDRHGPAYLPDNTAPTSLRGHRIDDQIVSLLSPPTTPRDMLDVTDFYTYDSLTVG